MIVSNRSTHSPIIRYMSLVAGIFTSFVFSLLWSLGMNETWVSCYVITVLLSLTFLWTHRHNLLSLSGIFIGLSLIAISLPAFPYLIFDLEPVSGFYDSIYLNSLGQMFFVTLAFYLSPSKSLYKPETLLFKNTEWKKFTRINGKICLITLPIVILTITQAGAWGYLLGDRSGEFDRIASMKGLGPLMIFSVINMMALFFWACGNWLNGKKAKTIIIVILLLFINGFTGGRQNIIAFFLGALIIHIAISSLNKKTLFFIPAIGLLIVFMKMFRVTGPSDVAEFPWYIGLFLQFAGDFDSLNNVSTLVEYTHQHGFFGFYHIWSNILVYVPRELFPGKPHDLGVLYLNTYLFPGVYLGADGGTGLALGFQGVWYAVYGLPTLLLGNLLLALTLTWADRRFHRRLHHAKPGLFLVAYIFLIGQSVITYRDGFYSFLNAFLYVGIYYLILIFIQSTTKQNATTSPSRPLEST